MLDRALSKSRLFRVTLAALAACLLAPHAASAQEKNVQYLPLLTYRTGAYASSGTPIWAGRLDYFTYLNETQGGINGVKLIWDECETNYEVEKGVECYERIKGGKQGLPTPLLLPNADHISKALIEKSAKDKIPVITLAYGLTEAIDGSVFPYSFPVVLSFYSEASSVVNFIAEKAGGKDKLKGLKIASVYHDSPYGRETIAPLELLAKTYGFENIQIPVPHPGADQTAQWARIREVKPDWVFLRGWGVMTPVAIKTAAKTGFPVDHLIGGVWSSSEEDVRPAGTAGKGYLALTPFPAGSDFAIHTAIKKEVIDKGKSDLRDPKSFGSVYYNSGIVEAIIVTEALRTAQAKFGNRPLTGEEAQWGLEHLDITDARLKEIGALGLSPRLKLSLRDHEGGGSAKVAQWDGTKWTPVSDWVRSDTELLKPLIFAKSAAYAKEKGITPRSGE
jgi:branched-chain amino acid transport system substrate-binding protein